MRYHDETNTYGDSSGIIISEKIDQLMPALHNAQGRLHYVQKDATNSHHKYNYLSEARLVEECKKAFQANDIVMFTSLCEEPKVIPEKQSTSKRGDVYHITLVKMELLLVHAPSGQWIRSVSYGEGHDNQDKGVYKAYTGALKYALAKANGISTGDDPEKEMQYKVEAARRELPVNDEPLHQAHLEAIAASAPDQDSVVPPLAAALHAARQEVEGKSLMDAFNHFLEKTGELGLDEKLVRSEFKLYRSQTNRQSTPEVAAEGYLFATREDKTIDPIKFAILLGVL